MNAPIRACVDEGIGFSQLSLFMDLDQLVFTILRQSHHSDREPVPLSPEQAGFWPQVLELDLGNVGLYNDIACYRYTDIFGILRRAEVRLAWLVLQTCDMA